MIAPGARRPGSRGETVKRGIDVAVSTVVLALSSPIMLVVAALIRATLGRPIFFVQERAGLHSRPFELVKFRTMRAVEPGQGEMGSDAQRLTGLGRALRATSVDELPTLVNVIKGDMSLVGPRPLPVAYLDRYSRGQARRHEVRPGITGWAQVNGRNSTSWSKRLSLDVWYVDHRSTPLDLRILLRTVTQVLKRADISHEGHSTMPEFMGEPAPSSTPGRDQSL
jgi:lipopolysaccharide/colanic/teichoic acid biosynthesis glycosyltransferase